MGYRGLRRTLAIFAIACWVGAIVVLGINFMPLTEPPDLKVDEANFRANRPAGRARKIGDVGRVELDAFQSVWNKQLHRPLIDPPPVATVAAIPEPQPRKMPPVDVRLVGTLVEENRKQRRAWVQIAAAPIRIVREGEQLADLPSRIEILEIEDRQLKIRQGGVESIIRIERADIPIFSKIESGAAR
jgi:hypothetical protein